MQFGVIYYPEGNFRECANEEQARNTFEHAPQGDDQIAVLVIDGVEVEERGSDEDPAELAGIIKNDRGWDALYVLYSRPEGAMCWENAREWAESVGGSLPTRQELTIILATRPELLQYASWLWTYTEARIGEERRKYAAHINGGMKAFSREEKFYCIAICRYQITRLAVR